MSSFCPFRRSNLPEVQNTASLGRWSRGCIGPKIAPVSALSVCLVSDGGTCAPKRACSSNWIIAIKGIICCYFVEVKCVDDTGNMSGWSSGEGDGLDRIVRSCRGFESHS